MEGIYIYHSNFQTGYEDEIQEAFRQFKKIHSLRLLDVNDKPVYDAVFNSPNFGGVTDIPTFLLVDGKKVHKSVGATDILGFLAKILPRQKQTRRNNGGEAEHFHPPPQRQPQPQPQPQLPFNPDVPRRQPTNEEIASSQLTMKTQSKDYVEKIRAEIEQQKQQRNLGDVQLPPPPQQSMQQLGAGNIGWMAQQPPPNTQQPPQQMQPPTQPSSMTMSSRRDLIESMHH